MKTAGEIYVNGRFLQQRITGVQRFAREIVTHLDQHIGAHDWAMTRRWVLLTPPGAGVDLPLINFERRAVGPGHGHVWEQTSLAYAARDGILVGLANAGPVFHPRQLVVMHDAAVFRFPENYSRQYRFVHRALSRRLARSARLATVSEFSRNELAEVLGCNPEHMAVVSNAVGHCDRIESDRSVLARLELEEGRYFLVVGSHARNKNIGVAVRSFLRAGLPDQKLVVVGDVAPSVFGGGEDLGGRSVVIAGRLPDDELSALYRSSTALIFPSLYEGFGIPPLEAMANDCPVLASDIPAVREVCGAAAEYFNPCDEDRLTQLLKERTSDSAQRKIWQALGQVRSARFTWSESAERLLSLVQQMTGESERHTPPHRGERGFVATEPGHAP